MQSMNSRRGHEERDLPFMSYPHEVLAVTLAVRADRLHVLLWRRAQAPYRLAWALPGGGVAPRQRLREALVGHLARKVNIRDISWLEQVATHSKVDRDPRARVLATGYLALVPSGADPALPDDTRWFPINDLPRTAFDHRDFVDAGVERLRAKLSYTNMAFALAPKEFTIATLRGIVSAALGYQVGATNLTRVMTRRDVIVNTGRTAPASTAGGRPAAIYRFRDRTLTVTDPFAVLKPPRP
jgi:ADP-ribose pyrophosphatase YjhB (NUDIX family)